MTEFLNETIAASVNSAAPLEVEVMKEALLEVEVPLFYIHSGKKEIQDYVNNVSKPEINQYIEDYAKPIVDEVVTRDAAQLIDSYLENTTKPAIDEYTAEKMKPWVTTAEKAATDASDSAKAASSSATAAALAQEAVDASVLTAQTAATAAGQSKNAAAESATSASNSAGTAQELVSNFDTTVSTATSAAVATIEQAASSLSRTFNLFDVKWADHQIDDIRWLRADTFSWQDGTVYSAAYQELWNEMQSSETVSESESVNGITISYLRTPKGYKIVNYTPAAGEERAAVVASIYDSAGVAWYYILDGVNQRFKLPRTKYGFVGPRGAVGGYVPESLPNITGTATVRQNVPAAEGSGAMYWEKLTTPQAELAAMQSITGDTRNLTFNASRSSAAYQNGAAVQQRGTQMCLYFYVGNYTQPAIEQTAGLNAELLNDKADVDLGNLPANIDYVVESGETGGVWYRRWKSGWLEQGQTNKTVTTGGNVVNFVKPYAENPVISFTRYSTYSGSVSNASYWGNTWQGRTTTNFTVAADTAYGAVITWYACGQGE